MIKLKRINEEVSTDDGYRILAEGLWPQGIPKEKAAVDLWLKEIAPGKELMRWFGRDSGKWRVFRERYWNELEKKQDLIKTIVEKTKRGNVTLVYSEKDDLHNGAVILKSFLHKHKDGETCFQLSKKGKCTKHKYLKV